MLLCINKASKYFDSILKRLLTKNATKMSYKMLKCVRPSSSALNCTTRKLITVPLTHQIEEVFDLALNDMKKGANRGD